MTPSRVSVITVVHNGERYLAAAIESVLSQRHPPSEVVVVDDGSTDASLAVAQRFGPPVRCISQDWRGIGSARNLGCATSRGDYVAFLDADDLWTPNALASQLAAFAADPRLDLVFGHQREFISPDVDGSTASRLVCRGELEPGWHGCAVLVRRSAFKRVGEFREDLTTGEYLDWFARAREHGLNEKMIEEHVLCRRVHESNHGLLRGRDARGDYARILKAALDRRRAADQPAPAAERGSGF